MTSKIEVIQLNKNEEKRWNNLLFCSVNASYRQSMAFEYTRENKGREINTFIFIQNGLDIAGAHYSLIRSKANIISTADVLSGFVFRKEPDPVLLSFLLKHFTNWATQKNASYARIHPWFPKSINGSKTKYLELFNEVLSNFSYNNILNGRHTYWIDLTLSEEELLNKMHSQTRRKIKKGLNSDIKLETFDKPGFKELDAFWLLYEKLGKTKGFDTLKYTELKNEISALTNQGLGRLYLLKFKGVVVNVSFASNFSIATYYHGALNPDYQKLENCPSPGHISQWLMISDNKSRGIKTYDMAFCPGPVPIKEHINYGIWRFKYEFGGDYVEFLPSYGKILKPLRGRIFEFLKSYK